MPRPHGTDRYQQFLERLRAARHAAKLRQVEVAQAFGSTQTFISKCERGERLVNALDLFDFAQLYGVPMSSLVPARLEEPGAIPDIATGRDRRVAEPRVRPGASEQEVGAERAPKKHLSKRGARQQGTTGKRAGRKNAGAGRGKTGLAMASSRKPGSKQTGSRKPKKRAADNKAFRKRKRPLEDSK